MGSSSTRILHVDDDPTFAELVETLLEQERDSFEVVSMTDPTAVPEYLGDDDVDCVVSDYDMPRMDGLELLETVRSTHPNLPFILFTGKGTEAVASQAISSGVTEYLQKEGGTEQFTVLANRIENAVDQREHERRFETLVDNLPGVVYRTRNSTEWTSEFAGGEVEDLVGYPASALEANEVTWGENLIHPDDRDHVQRKIEEALEDDGSFTLTYRIVTREGDVKWVLEQGQRVGTSESGEAILEGFVTDITERKESQEELERQQTVLSTLLENLPVGILVEDESREIVAANSTLGDAFGIDVTADDLVSRDCVQAAEEMKHVFVDPDRFLDSITETLDSREPVSGAEFVLDDGRILERSYIPYELPDGDANLWVYEDVTERKRQERELKRERERFSRLFENFPEPTVAYWYDGDRPRVHSVNGAFEETFGYDADYAIDEYINDLIVPDDRMDEARRIDERARKGELLNEEVTRRTVEGEHHFKFRDIPIDGDEEIDGFAVYTDIHERLERERELTRQNTRLEEFASLVSHDLRNPLNVAQLRLDLVAADCDSENVDDVERALDRMGQLIDDLLTLARQGHAVGETEPLRLEDVVSQCWDTVETDGVTLDCRLDRTVHADRSRLASVLENLFRNAVEHGGKGVTITVGELPGGNGFYVADDGEGLSEDEYDRIFESGFSTKSDGTGFGLTIVRDIVQAHGWDIRATESEDGGVRFEISGVEFAE